MQPHRCAIFRAGYLAVTTISGQNSGMTVEIASDLVANVASVNVSVGQKVAVGDEVALLESMKMEIPVIAEHGGTVAAVKVSTGEVIQEGDVIVVLD